MSSVVGVVDAGVIAVAAVVDAGTAAASTAMVAGVPAATPQATSFDWLHAGPVPAAVVTGMVAVLGWWVNRLLERFKLTLASDLAAGTEKLKWDLAAGTERMKHDLAETLAKRTRRADYVRDQIEKLYGPLAFLMESSAQLSATIRSIVTWQKNQSGKPRAAIEHHGHSSDALVKYVELVADNSKQALKTLQTEWGWLDPDDAVAAGRQISHVFRFTVEWEQGKRMPAEFYTDGDLTRDVPLYDDDFMGRVRRKLREKQRELAGLTGVDADEPAPVPVSAAAPDQ